MDAKGFDFKYTTTPPEPGRMYIVTYSLFWQVALKMTISLLNWVSKKAMETSIRIPMRGPEDGLHIDDRPNEEISYSDAKPKPGRGTF